MTVSSLTVYTSNFIVDIIRNSEKAGSSASIQLPFLLCHSLLQRLWHSLRLLYWAVNCVYEHVSVQHLTVDYSSCHVLSLAAVKLKVQCGVVRGADLLLSKCNTEILCKLLNTHTKNAQLHQIRRCMFSENSPATCD